METDNEILINTLLSLKHVLASYHDTVEDYIIKLEELETLRDNQKSTCGCGCEEPPVDIGNAKTWRKLTPEELQSFLDVCEQRVKAQYGN